MRHLPTALPLLVYLHCTTELSPTSQDQVAFLWVDFIDHWLIFTFSLPMLLWAILRLSPLIPYLPLRFYLSRGSSLSFWALLYSQLHHPPCVPHISIRTTWPWPIPPMTTTNSPAGRNWWTARVQNQWNPGLLLSTIKGTLPSQMVQIQRHHRRDIMGGCWWLRKCTGPVAIIPYSLSPEAQPLGRNQHHPRINAINW